MIDHRYFINKFPKIELFYDKILHRKVHADLYILIPSGIKAFAWFTYYKNKNICVFMHLNKYNLITKVEETVLSYDKNLSYGTIIYGTYFKHNNINYFSSEDIYYYKGDDIHNNSVYIDRLQILKKIFDSELKQVAYTNNSTIFGLPYICETLKDAFSKIRLLEYNIRGVLFRDFNKNTEHGLLLNKQEKPPECIFKIKADIQLDIYNLYCKDYKNDFYDLACIPDYKTSVLMNNLFRTIKENINLDLLEESDEEEVFENISEDKYVNLKKIVYMKCVYIKKFKKWKPVEQVKFGEKLLTKKEIFILEKR
tara:strand:- start:2141 stop:3070 length:930 start_codon:yes stop_codon:yes gene_type:complete